jgi:hypothetical protein
VQASAGVKAKSAKTATKNVSAEQLLAEVGQASM